MQAIARVLVVSLLAGGGAAAVAGFSLPASHADAARGGVIKVRVSVAPQPAGRPVDVRATVSDGLIVGEERHVRTVVLRGAEGASLVVELTHTGRLTLESANGAVRVVASYAAEPPGVQVSEAQWRALRMATTGTRVELQRTGSFVSPVSSPAPAAATQ